MQVASIFIYETLFTKHGYCVKKQINNKKKTCFTQLIAKIYYYHQVEKEIR